MPDEIEEIKNLEDEGISLKEENIMHPEPSQEQMALCEEIEKNITEKIIERDNLFGSLAKDIRISLASEYVSNKLVKIGQKHNLSKDQIIALAYHIKTLFIDVSKEKIEISTLIRLLGSNLDINTEKAENLFQDLNNEILLPTLKNIPAEIGPTEQKETIKPSMTLKPKAKDERIVDLKNLTEE